MFARMIPALRHTGLDEVTMPSVMEALDCLRVAITVFDAQERLIFANEHFSYLFRSLPPREELAGRTYEDMIRMEISGGDITGADVLNDVENYVACRRAQFFAGDYAPRDVPLADGRIIEIKTRRTKERGWIALWTDVTHARQNLDQLHATIALSADAFAFFDRNDRLTLCNEEYAAINGASSPDDLKGLAFTKVIERVADHAVANADINLWLKKRTEIHSVPAGAMTVETNSGTAYLLRDRAASDGGRIVVFTDITEHHRVEKSLAEQTRTLDATRRALAATKAESEVQANYLAALSTKLDQTAASADTTKTTLLRTMSHELKTPLNAIIGFSDLLGSLADHASADQIREYSGLIHLGGKNLLRLLNQILDLTRVSAGRYDLQRQIMDVGGSLWETTQRFEDSASAKNIKIEAVDCALGVVADEGAYMAMLNYLVENAVNFTHSGGKVWLSAEQVGTMIHITVADNGPGVAESDLARILEPFEQGGRSTTDHQAGAGLGLTLVKALSELHGGRLTVQSAPGAGFTATIALPAEK
jgi:signal transduction histidine kinase